MKRPAGQTTVRFEDGGDLTCWSLRTCKLGAWKMLGVWGFSGGRASFWYLRDTPQKLGDQSSEPLGISKIASRYQINSVAEPVNSFLRQLSLHVSFTLLIQNSNS
jgi:hypothetical protein